MWINGVFYPFANGMYFDADKGGGAGGGSGEGDGSGSSSGSGDGGDNNNNGGDGSGDNNNGDNNNKPDIEAIKKELEKQHNKELDRYRNDIGQLKKELKKLQEKEMSEEEKLEAEKAELEKEKKALLVDKLDAHKSQQIAEQELDKRLADYIKINAEKSKDDITDDIKILKTAVDAIVQERIEELQESGSVLNGFNFNSGSKNKGKGSIGEQLAKFNNENNKGAAEAQGHYF